MNYEIGTVKNIHYGDIHTKFNALFDISKEKVPFVNDQQSLNKILQENYCQEGDIIFADASEDLNDVGKCIEIIHLNNEKLVSGLHTLLARPQRNIFHIGFNGYLFQSNNVRLQIQKEAQGTKVLSISAGRISNIFIHYPSISEQKKISQILTSIESRISTQNKIIEQLESLMRGVRKQIFEQEIRFKRKDGNNFPDWELKRMNELTNIFDGTHQTPKYVDAGIPFYSVEQLTSNDFRNTKYISRKVFENESKRVRIEKGDILMSRIGDIGTSRLVFWEVEASFYVSIVLIKQSSKFNSKYMHYFINSEFFQNELWLRTIHVAFPQKINLGEIGECKAYLPCIEEQIMIANFLSSIDQKIETEKKILKGYENQKKYLLQNLFI